MFSSDGCVGVKVDLSDDGMPQSLRDAIQESGMTPEAYMDAAAENIQHIATLVRSCVDLYMDRKPALDYLGFSFVAGSALAGGTDSHVSVTQVLCGSSDGIIHSLKNILQETLEDAFKVALDDVFEDG